MQLWRTPDSFTAERRKPWRKARGAGAQPLHRRAAPQRLADTMDAIASPRPSTSPDEAERNRLAEHARSLLHQLPGEQGKALEMAVFDGLNHIEIAEVTGEPVGAVKTTLRARC